MATMLEKWQTLDDFIKFNNPSCQRDICVNQSNCYFGNSPTLIMLKHAYGKGAAQAWLIPQIANAVVFSGVDGVPDTEAFIDLATIIESERSYLKVKELMLFFWRFKAGHYCHFYKTFEPHIILNSLADFIVERNNAYRRHDEEEKSRKEIEYNIRHPPMSWQEYQRTKISLSNTKTTNNGKDKGFSN